jgi:legumain
VDHGTTGLLAFPDDYLYADQLNNALKYMFGSSSYRKVIKYNRIYIILVEYFQSWLIMKNYIFRLKMLLYIEACHAGSMFDGILQDNTDSKLNSVVLRRTSKFIVNQIML